MSKVKWKDLTEEDTYRLRTYLRQLVIYHDPTFMYLEQDERDKHLVELGLVQQCNSKHCELSSKGLKFLMKNIRKLPRIAAYKRYIKERKVDSQAAISQ